MEQPDWYNWIGQISAGVGAIALIFWFLKSGLPKIIEKYETQLTSTTSQFIDTLERQETRHMEQEDRQRADFKLELSEIRIAQKEATEAQNESNIVSLRLIDSMDNLRSDVRELSNSYRKHTGSYAPVKK